MKKVIRLLIIASVMFSLCLWQNQKVYADEGQAPVGSASTGSEGTSESAPENTQVQSNVNEAQDATGSDSEGAEQTGGSASDTSEDNSEGSGDGQASEGMSMMLAAAPEGGNNNASNENSEGTDGQGGNNGEQEQPENTPEDAGQPGEGAPEETPKAEGGSETEEAQGAAAVDQLEQETAETVIQNAIQAQIDSVLNNNNASQSNESHESNNSNENNNPHEYFVEVEEGVYDGDINIVAADPAAILYLLAPGSYEKDDKGNVKKESIKPASDGNTRVNGDITIEGINVVLAGIYYSLGTKIAISESETTIYGTIQDDNIEVELQKNAKALIYGGDGADTITLTGEEASGDPKQTISETGERTAVIDGGGGADVVEIDLSTGGDEKQKAEGDETKAKAKETAVTVKGDAEDRVHLSGTLLKGDKDKEDENSKIDTNTEGDNPDPSKTYARKTIDRETSVIKYSINLMGENVRTLLITEGIEKFTDELKNKITVKITNDTITNGTLNPGTVDKRAFVNYVYEVTDKDNKKVTVPNIKVSSGDDANASSTLFSQLVLGKAGLTTDVKNIETKATSNNITSGMNILIIGRDINIKGTIDAGPADVVVRAYDDDMNINTKEKYDQYAPKFIKDIIGKESPVNMTLSIFNVKSISSINTEAASNITGGRVDLKSYTKQTQPLVPFTNLFGADFVSVKITESVINLLGSITSAAVVLARSASIVSATASNQMVADWYIPIAASVLLSEAGVFVKGSKAKIVANAVKLLSDSSVKVSVSSTVGTVPVSVAVAAVMNDSHVEISDSADIKATDSVTALANGRLIATTRSHAKSVDKDDEKKTKDDAKNKGTNTDTSQSASDKDKSNNKYGAFISVAVALQDVGVKILGGSNVTSEKKNIYLLSSALESVVTSAIATVPTNVKKKDGKTAEENNGKVASKDENKSAKDKDNSDARSVKNTEETASNLLEAAKKAKDTNGNETDDKSKKKIEKLQNAVTGTNTATNTNTDTAAASEENTGVSNAVDQGTSGSDASEQDTATNAKKKSELQLAGAIAVNVASNINTVLIEGNLKAEKGTVSALADAMTYSKAVANATGVNGEGQDSENKRNALGAAVAVNIAKHLNTAELKSGNINAANLNVCARSGAEGLPVTVFTEAIAGLSGNDAKDGMGIAGAIAVDVATIKTKALIDKDTKATVSKDLVVKAASDEVINSVAKTNVEVKGKNDKTMGFGAAIAVGVNGIDTIASIGDVTNPVNISNMENLTVNADHSLTEEITATAGTISTNKAVSPSVVVDVSGVDTESITYLNPSDGILILSGDFSQEAGSVIDRTLSSDADAKSENPDTNAAGTVLVSVLNDSTHTISKSSIKANNINVSANGKSKLNKATARANSRGAKKAKKDSSSGSGSDDSASDEDGDRQADKAINGAKNLAKKVASKNVNEAAVNKQTENRQKTQTTEGNVSVSAAIVVNIMNHSVKAEITGNSIEAANSGKITVTAENLTEAYILADASAVAASRDSAGSVSDGTGVGAAAAINILNIEDIASIKSIADIKAGSILVKANTASKKTVEETVKDENGNPVQEDVLDENGNPVMEDELDENGQPKKDENGNVIKKKKTKDKTEPKIVDTQSPIRTYSVSGAGAGGVGVAGSVAITKIYGNVNAFIECGENRAYKKITASIGDVEVTSNVMQLEETLATASIKKNGIPDVNDEGESKAAVEDSKQANDTGEGETVAKINDKDKNNNGNTANSENSGEAGNTKNKEPEKNAKNNPKNPNNEESSAVGVGASVALSISELKSDAYILASSISAVNVKVAASEDIIRRTYSTAGTDPIKSGAAASAKTSVDASVAFAYATDEAKVNVDKNTNITATGNVDITAAHTSKTRTQASGFALGDRSAVGGAVAVNIAKADVIVNFIGKIDADGTVTVSGTTDDSDYSFALASSKGTTEKKAKEDGNDQPGDKNKNNKTATEVNKALNNNKSKKATGDADNKKAFSTNVLKTQGAKTESTKENSEVGKAVKEAKTEANKQVTNKDKAGLDKNEGIKSGVAEQEETQVTVAAAVGINVTGHKVNVSITGPITTKGKAVKISADNTAAFTALGTAYTMTQMPADAAVAVGVSVGINNNEAVIVIADSSSINAVDNNTRGNVDITVNMSQNRNNSYCASQAVSGSIARKAGDEQSAKVAAAGAVAILISDAKGNVKIGNGFAVSGADISFGAEDDYKLLVRAGSINYARKANVGIGASFGMIYADDDISVTVGDGLVLEGNSFSAQAKKLLSQDAPGFFGYIMKGMNLFGAYQDNQTVKAETDADGQREVKLSSPDFISTNNTILAGNVINIFINDNYHIESFSGSFAGGQGALNAAGAVSLAFLNTNVESTIGKNANIKLLVREKKSTDQKTDQEEQQQEEFNGITISALDSARTGVYTIGISGSNAKTGAGASISVIIDKGKTRASLHDNAQVEILSDGGFSLTAKTEQNNIIISVAAAVTTDDNSKSLGGNVNVFYSSHETGALLNNAIKVLAGNGITIAADFDNDTLLIAAGAQGSKNTAAGGTVSVGIYNGTTTAKAVNTESGPELLMRAADGDITVRAHSKEKLISVVANASAALSGSTVGAVINVLVSKTTTLAELGKGKISALKGSLNVTADSTSLMTLIDAAFALGGKSTAVGGIVAVTVLNRTVKATVDSIKAYEVGRVAAKNVLVSATGDDYLLQVLAVGGASAGNAFGGVIGVTVQNSDIEANIKNSEINADGSIGVASYLDSVNYLIAAVIEGSKKAAVGGVINTQVLNNTVISEVGTGSVLNSGLTEVLALPSLNGRTDDEKKNKKRNIRGIAIDAGENLKSWMIGASGAGSGKVTVTGVINTFVATSTVRARSRATKLTAVKTKGATSDDGSAHPAVEIIASSKTDIIDAAGSLSGAGKVGVGATVVVFTYKSEIDASAVGTSIDTTGDLFVEATKDDKTFLVSVSLSGAGIAAVSVAPNVLVYQNTVTSSVEVSTANIGDGTKQGEVTIRSNAFSEINMLGAAISGSGTAAVSLSGNVIYFKNMTGAHLKGSTKVSANKLSVESNTKELINADCAGIAGSGTAAIGGAVDVIVSEVGSYVWIDANSVIDVNGPVLVAAEDYYSFYAIVGSIAGSGTAGVVVSAIVGVITNVMQVKIEDGVRLTAKDDVDVKAVSNRQIMGFSGFVTGAGVAAVGASVVVFVMGKGIDKDSYDAVFGKGVSIDTILNDAFNNTDSRSKDTGSINDSIKQAVKANKESAVDVSKKGADNGDYGKYSNNGNKEVSDSVLEKTSTNLKSNVRDETDAIGAWICENAIVVSKEGSINVKAEENVSAAVISGGLSIGGTAGVGASITVVIVGSFVDAEVFSGATVEAAKNVNVNAKLTHERSTRKLSASSNPISRLNEALVKALSKKDDIEKESTKSSKPSGIGDFGVFVLNVSIGGGSVGVAATVAYFNNSAKVKAIVNGSITQKGEGAVNISADTDMGNVGVFNGSLAAGAVGVAATVSLATVETISEAALNGNTIKPTVVNGDLNVSSKASGNMLTINGALAGGLVAVAVILSIANNRISSIAHIGGDSVIDVKGKLAVLSDVNADLKGYLANITAGAIAAGVTVSIANNKAASYAYIGDKDSNKVNTSAGIKAGNIDVSSKANGDVFTFGASVSAGAIAANGSVVLSFQKSVNMAGIKNISVSTYVNTNKDDSISIRAYMDGSARSNVVAVSAGAIGFGAAVVISDITAVNKASVEMDKASLKSSNIVIEARGYKDQYYKTGATTSVVTGAAGAIAAAFNFAYATNNAKNIASLTTNGNLEASSVDIRSYAMNTALAVTASGCAAGLSINVTRSKAVLEGENKAEFRSGSNADVRVGKLSTAAYHNLDSTKPEAIELVANLQAIKINPTEAVEAWIYSGAGALISLSANIATAKSDFKVISNIEFDGGKVAVTKSISSTVEGTSKARAKSESLAFAAGKFGVIQAEADAAGTYEASVINKAKESKIDLSDGITIKSTFISKAITQVEPAKTGVDASIAKADVNKASAKATSVSTAKGSGNFGNMKGALVIESTGKTSADAKIIGAKFSASVAAFTSNDITSTVDVTNRAYYDGQGNDLSAGSVTIKAAIDDITSYAKGGSSQSGTKVSLIGGGSTDIAATSAVSNEAYITDTNASVSGAVSIISDVAGESKDFKNGEKKVHVTAEATSPDLSIGIATGEAIKTSTNETGNVTARLGKNSNIDCDSFTLYSGFASEVSSIGSAPGVSVTLLAGDSVVVVTEASKNNDRKVRSAVESGSNINARKGSVNIDAISHLEANAHLNDVKSFSGIDLGSYLLQTKVGKTTALVEVDGTIYADDAITLNANEYYKSNIDKFEVVNGGLIGGSESRAVGHKDQMTADVIIGTTDGRTTAITATRGAIKIYSTTAADMFNEIRNASYGLGSKTSLKASNNLGRYTRVTLKDNVVIDANNHIEIIADAENVTMKSIATGDAAGGYNKAVPTAVIDYYSNGSVNTGLANSINSYFGKVTINANESNNLYASAEHTASIAIGSNTPTATINANQYSTIRIDYRWNIEDQDKKNRELTKIAGVDVEIASYLKDIKHEAKTNALTKSLGNRSEATSKIKSYNHGEVQIDRADISGYETLYIYALTLKIKEDATATAEIRGFTGKVYSNADVSGNINNTVSVGNWKENAILRGPDVLIKNTDTKSLETSIIRSASVKGDTSTNKFTKALETGSDVMMQNQKTMMFPFGILMGITSKFVSKVVKTVTYSDAEAKELGSYIISGNINAYINLYCGQYGAGVNLMIDKDGKVTSAGISKDDLNRFVTVENGKIEVHDIKTDKAGKFKIEANGPLNESRGNLIFNNASYVSALNIDNYSTMPLYLRRINLLGDQLTDAKIEYTVPESIKVSYGEGKAPEVKIASLAGADVIFGLDDPVNPVNSGNDLDAGEGSIMVLMPAGGNVITETAKNCEAFIAANTVSITGADNIGGDIPFRVFLIDVAPINEDGITRSGINASLIASAKTNIVIAISPVRLYYKNPNDDTAVYKITDLVSKYIILTVTKAYYATLIKPASITGEYIQGRNRAFIARDMACTFYMGNVRAETMLVRAEANNKKLYSFENMPNTTFSVENDVLKIFRGNVRWNINSSNDGGSGYQGRNNGSGSGENGSSSDSGIVPVNALSLPLFGNVLKPESILPPVNDRKTRNAYYRYYNKISNAANVKRTGNYKNRNYNFFGEMSLEDLVGSDLAAGLMEFADLCLIVDKNGWSYIILASNIAVDDMIETICSESTATTLSEMSMFMSALSLLADGAMIQMFSGFNYLFVLIPVLMLLFLFLILTRRKKKEEEVTA